MDEQVLISLMVELAGLEEELADARAKVQHHSRREDHLAELQDEYDEDETDAASAELGAAVRLRAAERGIREAEAALAHKRERVVGISDRRQYEALQTEIRRLEQDIDRLETEAIELLGEVERSGEHLFSARAERQRQEARGRSERERLAAEAERAKAAAAEIEQELARVQAMLPDAVLRHFVRLRKQYPTGIVRVVNGACGGCFGQLPPQQALDAAKGRAVVRCPSCARYVVHRSWN